MTTSEKRFYFDEAFEEGEEFDDGETVTTERYRYWAIRERTTKTGDLVSSWEIARSHSKRHAEQIVSLLNRGANA